MTVAGHEGPIYFSGVIPNIFLKIFAHNTLFGIGLLFKYRNCGWFQTGRDYSFYENVSMNQTGHGRR